MNAALIANLVATIAAALRRRRAIRTEVLPLIEQAAMMYGSDAGNTARREWVLEQLGAKGLSESQARLLTEAGVALWKKLAAKRAKKAAKKKP